MKKAQEIPWKRTSAEGFAIVVSILLAFGIDTWWDERQVEGDVRAQLASLRDELVATRTGLEEVLGSVEEHGARIDELVLILQAAGESGIMVPNKLLGSAITWRTSDVSLSALESLRVSGGLGKIASPELRGGLAGLPALVNDVQEDELIGQQFVESIMAPALARLGIAAPAYSNRLGYREENHGGETRVMPSAELIGLLTIRQVHIGFSTGGLPRLREEINWLIGLIDAENQ
jgi:hypothetical protein